MNEHFLQLPGSYLFSDIARRVKEFEEQHPGVPLIRMGIGDVTRPLPGAVIAAMRSATDEMAEQATFRGYGPEQGYGFLREAIIENDYRSRGISLDPDEIFVSDGAKSDTGNIGDILGRENTVAVTDPVYPVYVDTNVMAGRAGELLPDGTWSNIRYLPCTAENGFIPELPDKPVDIIYLCFPNNPTGTALRRNELKKWVDFAIDTRALILFDAAYEAFITECDVPHSIYEVRGAKQVAVEFRSFSKTAGFTGTRCAYTVVPKDLFVYTGAGEKTALNSLWNRRQTTKFNGVSYVVQRAAQAVYSEEGRRQVEKTVGYYMQNALLIRRSLTDAGFEAYGGVNAPYIWIKAPQGLSSWKFFDMLLNEAHVIGTPGAGFGPSGEGYLRLTAFGDRELTQEAMHRIAAWKMSSVKARG